MPPIPDCRSLELVKRRDSERLPLDSVIELVREPLKLLLRLKILLGFDRNVRLR
jgi:hypothetical protein